MSRLTRAVLPALLLACAAAPALAHEGDPNYRSEVREIAPPADGLTAQVLDHDDALLLINRSGKDVVVLGVGGAPFARLLADGTVQVDRRAPSPARPEPGEEEEEREDGRADADGALLASLDGALLAHGDEEHDEHEDDGRDAGGGAGGPRWTTLDRTGRFQWHDRRINYRASAVPPQVTDTSEETKVKDWRVPLLVAGQPAAIEGTLTWVGEPGDGSSFPTAAVVSLVAIVLVGGGAVLLARRRRAA